MSTSTRRSKLRERSSSSQISSETSPGASPLIRTCVGVTTSASATAGSVTETRFSLSVVLIRRDLPTITRSGAAPAVMLWPDADVAAVEDCAAGGLSWFGEPWFGESWFGESWFGEEREAVARAAGGAPSGATVRASALVANMVAAPRRITAATSVGAFMNSHLCEDARANPSRADRSREDSSRDERTRIVAVLGAQNLLVSSRLLPRIISTV